MWWKYDISSKILAMFMATVFMIALHQLSNVDIIAVFLLIFFLFSRYFFYFLCMEMSMIVMHFFCFGDIGCGIHQTSSWGSREISLRECLHWQTLSPNCNLYFVNILIHFCVMIHLGFFISLKFVKSRNLNYKFFAWFHNWK